MRVRRKAWWAAENRKLILIRQERDAVMEYGPEAGILLQRHVTDYDRRRLKGDFPEGRPDKEFR